jgi:hypothetical protein
MFSRYLVVAAIASAALAQQPAAKKWAAPRTADGKPDLQGIWTHVTLTPLERPAEFVNKPFFASKAEAAQYASDLSARNNADQAPTSGSVGSYNNVWYGRGNSVVPTLRTSLIIDPPDGRVPALTPAAQRRIDENQKHLQRLAEGPEDRSLAERCILWGTTGPPMMPGPYNNNYQIVQGPGYVMIVVEMIHEVRIIPTDNSQHLPPSIRQWRGDSRGRWEGDTLVVDTTNFNDQTMFRGASRDMHLVEKFTRTAPDQVMYEFTVDDPSSFARSWTAQLPMSPGEGPILEYACTEGNYAMESILKGARQNERKGQQ